MSAEHVSCPLFQTVAGRRAGASHCRKWAKPTGGVGPARPLRQIQDITHFITGAGGNGEHAGDWRPIGRRHSRGRERAYLLDQSIRSSQMLESRSMPSGASRRVNGAWLAVQARWRITGWLTLVELTDMPPAEADAPRSLRVDGVLTSGLGRIVPLGAPRIGVVDALARRWPARKRPVQSAPWPQLFKPFHPGAPPSLQGDGQRVPAISPTPVARVPCRSRPASAIQAHGRKEDAA